MDNILTKKQELVLRLIKQYYLENGTAPSLGELQHNLGISTKRPYRGCFWPTPSAFGAFPPGREASRPEGFS